jgi:hypothetical protein
MLLLHGIGFSCGGWAGVGWVGVSLFFIFWVTPVLGGEGGFFFSFLFQFCGLESLAKKFNFLGIFFLILH